MYEFRNSNDVFRTVSKLVTKAPKL